MHCLRVVKIALFFLPFLTTAQTPDFFWTAEAPEDENIQELAVDNAGNMLVGATFEDDLLSLNGAGETDLALIQLSAQGEVQWRRHFGSLLDDEWAGLAIDEDDSIYAAGSFWVELPVDTFLLTAEKNAKALFLTKLTNEGQLTWIRKIEGSGVKTASELTLDDRGGLLMTGFFSDTLFLGETPLVAYGRTDLFVARFLPDGRLDWVSHAGQSGNTRALSLAALPGGSVALTGYYDDTTRIGDDRLTANTFDRDVFVCLYDHTGQPKWARRAGGVHDDAATAIRYGAGDRLYVTGYLVGVISLSDEISIQSATGNSDFYLLAYDTTGAPTSARAYGGREIQQTTNLYIRDDQLWLSGFYQGEMTIDERTVDAGDGIGSFLARMGPDLALQKIYNFPSDGNLLVNALAFDADDRLVFGGGYTGSQWIGGQTISAEGGFDLFLSQILQATPVEPSIQAFPDLTVFPNPASDRVFIKTEVNYQHIRLVNSQGITVFQSNRPVPSIPVEQLPAGMYYLIVHQKGKYQSVQIILTGRNP